MTDNTATQVATLRNQIAEQKAQLKALEQIQKRIEKRQNEIKKFGLKMDEMLKKDSMAGIIWTINRFQIKEKLNSFQHLPTKKDTLKALIEFFYNSSLAQQFKIKISPHKRYKANYYFPFESYRELIKNLYPQFEFEMEDLYNSVWDLFPLLLTSENECNICNEKKCKAEMVKFNHDLNGKKVRACECKYDCCDDCASKINPKKCFLCRKQWTGLFWEH